ncbi:MAG: HEPN domain-containing protein [Elusimicrobiota bacterium]
MRPDIFKEWIQKADEDFEFAVASLECGAYYAQICFHFQQAAEKYLKAFIIANQLNFRPVHNLLELLLICGKKEPKIKEIEENCQYLNAFYIDTRYPVHWPTDYDQKTALQAKDAAERIKKWIKLRLREEK